MRGDMTLEQALDEAWSELGSSIFVMQNLGLPIESLPDISEAAARDRSARAARWLERAAALDPETLSTDDAITLAVARQVMQRRAREHDWYWLAFDPLGVGFFALFAPTAYGGGWLLNYLGNMFERHAFAQAGDLDRYLELVDQFGLLVRQLQARTAGQAKRGIRMPRPQLDQSIELMARLRGVAAAVLTPANNRLAAVGGDGAAAASVSISARIMSMRRSPSAWTCSGVRSSVVCNRTSSA